MDFTMCDSAMPVPARQQAQAEAFTVSGAPGLGQRSRLPAVVAAETRAYFRCHPLGATLSVQQCRANRARLSPHEALALPDDLPAWWVQPLACCSCTLAPQMEAGRVPFYSAEQVLAGQAMQEAPPAEPQSAAPPLA